MFHTDLLCDGVQLVLAALTECISANPGSPAPPPVPAPASAPAQRLPVLLLRRQQEHHADGHQDVPQRVGVVVVVLRLGKYVQTHPDEGADRPGEQEEDPALPGRRVTTSATDPSVHPGNDHEQYGAEDGAQQVPQAFTVQLHRHGYEQSPEHEQSIFECVFDASHAQDGDPDGAD